MKRTLKVRVGSVASALDRFEETWRKAARGEKAPAEHILTFTSLQLLLRTLTPAQWAITAEHEEYSHYGVFIMFRHIALHDLNHAYKIEDRLLRKEW